MAVCCAVPSIRLAGLHNQVRGGTWVNGKIQHESAVAAASARHGFSVCTALKISGAAPSIAVTSINAFLGIERSANGQIKHQQAIASRCGLQQMFVNTRLALCSAIPNIRLAGLHGQIC